MYLYLLTYMHTQQTHMYASAIQPLTGWLGFNGYTVPLESYTFG